LLIVHAKVAAEPAGTPVPVDVLEPGVVIVAVPLTTLQAPVPTTGLLAARVKIPLLQFSKAEPALEAVGRALFARTSVLLEDVQVPLEIVQRSVAVFPAATVTVDVGDDDAAMVADPLTTDHPPVPVTGVFAAIVKLELLHCVILEPANEVVGLA